MDDSFHFPQNPNDAECHQELTDEEKEILTAELNIAKEEIITLKEVLASKERHAEALRQKLGQSTWENLSNEVNQGLNRIQQSDAFKKTLENFAIAGDIAKEKFDGIFNKIAATNAFQNMSGNFFKTYSEKESKAYSPPVFDNDVKETKDDDNLK